MSLTELTLIEKLKGTTKDLEKNTPCMLHRHNFLEYATRIKKKSTG